MKRSVLSWRGFARSELGELLLVHFDEYKQAKY